MKAAKPKNVNRTAPPPVIVDQSNDPAVIKRMLAEAMESGVKFTYPTDA